MGTSIATTRLITGYYGATILFVILDYLFDFNVRLIFPESWPGWSSYIGAVESLLTLSMLIISMAVRVTIVTDEMIEQGRGFVTVRELLNFIIAGSITYISLMRGVLAERHKIL